ncbi:MAG: MFS transporter [Anaerolineales bacterium]
MVNGTRPVLLAFLSAQGGLSNTALGAISSGYVWMASATQPFFGWLADRIGPRWLAVLGILWLFAFFTLAMLTGGPLAIFYLIAASLGSAAFHPAGTMEATLAGRESADGRETSATSWFFFSGQFGFFLGPLLGGSLLGQFGEVGLLALTALLVPVGLNAAWQLRGRRAVHAAHIASAAEKSLVKLNRPVILALALVGGLQAWSQQNMMTFLPKYLSDLGQSPAVYGLITGLFMGGSALGNVLGGVLADKFGKQRVAGSALLLASLPLGLVAVTGWSAWLYLLVPLAGLLTGAVHSIVVVLAQRSLPLGMATASGLTLGFIFSAGALGTLLSGPLADAYGWPPVFGLTACLVLLAAALTVFVRE